MTESTELIAILHLCYWLVLTALIAMAAATLTQVLARRLAPAQPDEHWALEARRRFPVSRIQLFNFVFLMIFTPFFLQKLFGRSLLVSDTGMGLLSVVSTYAGLRFINYLFEAKPRQPKHTLVTLATMMLVVAFPLPILLIFGLTMPTTLGMHGLIWGLALVAVNLLFIRGLGIWIGRKLGLVHEPTAELQATVTELNSKVNIPHLKVWISANPAPNAYAFPWIKTIICSDGLMKALNPAEIRAICAHELGHLTEGTATVRRRLAAVWVGSLLLIVLYFFTVLNLEPWVSAAVAWAVALLVIFGTWKFARKQEERADGVALEHSGTAYASGLEKIYRLNGIPAVMGNRQIHPNLYDRILAAGVTPDFPRPEKPVTKILWIGMALTVLLTSALSFGWFMAAKLISHSEDKTEQSILLKMILEGSRPMDLVTLGWAAIDNENPGEAVKWFNLGINHAPDDYKVLTSTAYGYARLRDCEHAQKNLNTAEKLFERVKGQEDAEDTAWFNGVSEYVKYCSIDDL